MQCGPQPRSLAGSIAPLRPPHLRVMLVLHRVSSSLLGPVDPSFRALPGRLKFTVRRDEFDTDSLSVSSVWGETTPRAEA